MRGQDECGNYSGVGGLWDFWGLIQAGWLTKAGAPAPGIGYVYDSCTQTVSVSPLVVCAG
jgi:chitinase